MRWRDGARAADDIAASAWRELGDLRLTGPRALAPWMAALCVTLSVALTAMAHLPDPWWAGISGFMSLQATEPASVRRAILRVGGTAGGAAVAVSLLPALAYDHVAFGLALWVFASLGILGFMVSRHGYAWLFVGITFLLVSLLSMDDPPSVITNAFNRTVEVAIGSAVAVAVSWALAPNDEAPAASALAAPGWSDLLGARFPAVLYALRAGFLVMVMPLAWRAFELPSLTQMPVTVAAIMAVPIALDAPEGRRAVIVGRALQRMLGCLFGGLLGLACIAVGPEDFLPWLALLAAGVFLAAHIQASARGISYVGTQGAVAFILTLVQGAGPPTSILPGVDRFVGITLGLAVLLGVTVLLDAVFAPAASGPARRVDA